MKVKVIKLSKNRNNFRTPLEQLDHMPSMPENGKSLLLVSSTHTSGGVITTPVEFWQQEEDHLIVETVNSTYEIILEEENESKSN